MLRVVRPVLLEHEHCPQVVQAVQLVPNEHAKVVRMPKVDVSRAWGSEREPFRPRLQAAQAVAHRVVVEDHDAHGMDLDGQLAGAVVANVR